jgi:GT2 family glycosyltransferase
MQSSVIVATFNRPERLVKCLRALATQDFPRDEFEVIVVDDASDQPLDATVAPFFDLLQLRLERITHSGPGQARNHGAKLARGEIIAFTDDDCEPAPDWLIKLTAAARKATDCMAGGRTENRLVDNPYSSAAQAIVDIVYAHYNADPYHARFFTSNNLAVPAAGFWSIHGFDSAFAFASEDRDLCERWRQAGYAMTYLPYAKVLHSHAMTLGQFWRVHFAYGRGAATFHRRNRQRQQPGIKGHIQMHAKVTSWFFDSWRALPPGKAVGRMALLVVWQIANLAGFAYELALLVAASKVTRAPLR